MRNDFESNYLAHHGILGQKWGKRNGPPYPLGASDHSSSEKKAGYKKSLGGGRNTNLYDRKITRLHKAATASKKDADDLRKHGYKEEANAVQKVSNRNKAKANKIQKLKDTNNGGLTDNQKKVLKVGAAVAVTALAAYGGYKLAKSPKVRKMIAKGIASTKTKEALNLNPEVGGSFVGKIKASPMAKLKKYVEKGKLALMKLQGNTIDSSTGLAKFNKLPGKDTLIHGVNPNFSFYNPGSYMNCGNCALAYEARLRGFDVSAKMNQKGMTIAQFASYLKGLKSQSICEPHISVGNFDWSNGNVGYDDLMKWASTVEKDIKTAMLKQFPEGARGTIFLPMSEGSHYFSFERVGNDIKWINTQNPAVDDFTDEFFAKYFYYKNRMGTAVTAIRLDDLEFNSNISEVIQNNQLKGKLSNFLKRSMNNSDFDFSVLKGKNWVLNTEELYKIGR